MSTIVEKIQDHLDPSSAANGFHEVLLEWKKADDTLANYVPRGAGRYQIIQGERQAYEKVLSIFLGVSRNKVRQTLRDHYKVASHG